MRKAMMISALLAALSLGAAIDVASYGFGPDPKGIVATFASGVESRGIAWQTDTNVVESEVRLVRAQDGDGNTVLPGSFAATPLVYTGTCTTVSLPTTHCHRVMIDRLAPGTYFYRFGGAGHYVHGKMRVKAPGKTVTIVNLNDFQTSNPNKLWYAENALAASVRVIGGADKADFLLNGGDFVDGWLRRTESTTPRVLTGRSVEWGVVGDTLSAHYPLVPMVSSSGNHDFGDYGSRMPIRYPKGLFPGCESLDYGNVHIAAVPFAAGAWHERYEKIYAWLDRDLTAARARGRSDWVIVATHWGPNTTGDHAMHVPATTNFVVRLGELCAKHRVDLVLQAHDHTFSKTYAYRWSGKGWTTASNDAAAVNFTPRQTLVGGESYDTDPDGTYYLSAGCLGHRVGENVQFASPTGKYSYAKRRHRIEIGRLAVDSKWGRKGEPASVDLPRSMFGILRLDGRRLAYDWYVVDKDGSYALYDTLRVLKTTGASCGERERASGGEIAIAKGGVAKAAIVLAEDATETERFCAEELRHWTKELTGAELQVVAAGEGARSTGALPTTSPAQSVPTRSAGASPAPDLTVIRFSRADPEVKYDGFSVTASEREIVIAANRPIGIPFGIYYLLNRFGGIYWCHPDSGADFRKTPDFAIPAGRFVKTPMPYREGHSAGNGALSTPERRERVALWNIRNGFTLRSRTAGKDPEKTELFNYYPNGLMRKLGDPGVGEAGGHCLGECVLQAPVDEKELKESIEWTRAHQAEVFVDPKRSAPVLKYARWRVLAKHHPEWFGLVDGQRVPTSSSLVTGLAVKGKSSMPCLSNPEVLDLIRAGLRAEHQRVSGLGNPCRYVLICDDQSQWCECDECLKLLKKKGGADDKDMATEYWWNFINRIAPKLLEDPLVTLNVYVYRTYRTFPKRVKPIVRDRMSIVLCPHGRCYLHPLHDPNCPMNGKYCRMFDEWAQLGMPVITFEYMSQTQGRSNYAFWERAWIDDVKWYMKNKVSHGAGGLVGWWDAHRKYDNYYRRNEAKCRWQLAWLSGYFEWDPDDDFDAVRDRLFTVYYRAAEKPMKAYRALLEKAIYATGQCMGYSNGGTLFPAAAFQPGVLAEAKCLLGEARELAKGDAELERRIAADAEWFHTNWETAGVTGEVATEMARTDEAVTVDGRLDESFWRTATVLDDFRNILHNGDTDDVNKNPYSPPTALRLAFDDRNLYVGMTCSKADGKVLDIPDSGKTFDAMEGSHISLFLQMPSLAGRYYHVSISHNGKIYSALSTSGSVRDLAKKLDCRFAIGDAADAWTLEMSIPLKQFGTVKPGDVWKIDATRLAAGADGKLTRGFAALCGVGTHMPEYWKLISFGSASNLLANGSFDDLIPPPDPSSKTGHDAHDGHGWTFRSEKMPAGWFYQQNGGIGEAKAKDVQSKNFYLRLQGPRRGYGCFLWQDILPYPGETKALRFSFRARGKGTVAARVMQQSKQTKRVSATVDAPDWTDYSLEIPLDDLHPMRFMFDVSAERPLDLDDFVLTPVKRSIQPGGD